MLAIGNRHLEWLMLTLYENDRSVKLCQVTLLPFGIWKT
jgi:hypothetical protein